MGPPASRRIPRVLRYSGASWLSSGFVYGSLTLFGGAFQRASTTVPQCLMLVLNPRKHALWFGLFPFRSPLLRKSMFLSSPPGTEMFQFPGCPSLGLCIHPTMAGHYSGRVSPFGHLRINACLRLPVAFRSLPRPSSAYGALASALCSSSLDFSSISPKTNLISSSESLHRTEQSLIFDYRFPGNRLSRPYCAVVKVRPGSYRTLTGIRPFAP